MKKLTDILENKNVILDENSDASLEILLNEADAKPPENTDVGIVLSRLSDMISMSDDLYDTASSLEEIDKETADTVESTYNSIDELYAMFDDKYDIFRSDFDMGDIEMDEDFRISLDDLLNEATDELSEAFLRLPGHFINNELYGVERDLNTFIKGLKNGNDVNMKELNKIIKILQSAKKEVKKFNKPEDVPVSFQYKKESIDINEYFSKADLKLIDKMYDKKGNLTPLGRKVMNHGKKPGDKGYIEEATRRNQGLTDLFHNLAAVERQLRPNSPIHRLVEKTAEGNYTAEFKKMQKLVAPLVKMWDDIEADLDTDYPRESIEEAGGDWVVVDLNTKKVTYVKSYDAASKYVKKNGGVIASAEYYADNKKKFESVDINGATELNEREDLFKKWKQPNKGNPFMLVGEKIGFDGPGMMFGKKDPKKPIIGKVTKASASQLSVTWENASNDLAQRYKVINSNEFELLKYERSMAMDLPRGVMYVVRLKDRFREEKEIIEEDKYTDLGLSVSHTLNMAQTFWYKLGGKAQIDQKKYAKLEADYVKRGKVKVKLDDIGKVTFKNVTHHLTFKDKSKAMFHVSDKPGTPTVIGNFDALGVNGKRGNMFHSAIKDRDLDLTFTESIEEAKVPKTIEISVGASIQEVKYTKKSDIWEPKNKKSLKITKGGEYVVVDIEDKYRSGLAYIFKANDKTYMINHKEVKRVNESIEEAVSSSALSILKKVGFKEAPVDKTTTKVVNSLSGKKLKLTQLFGISMRAGKWADIFVGSTEDGKYFVVDPSGTTIFNKESELVTALKSAALGESINHFLKGGKDLNDIVG